tara:strand:- start:5731 stop:6081 length:351 start_codon:yes stop_codon:yes gene_type:complete
MNKFCTECGSKIEFSANEPPKFCSSCGAPLNGALRASTITEEVEQEEITESTKIRIPRNLKIEYEVSYAEGPKPMNQVMKEQKLGLGKIQRNKVEGDPLERAMKECRPARGTIDLG